MSGHRPEVANVFRQHGQGFLERWRDTLSFRQIKTLYDIGACRTAALGAHLHVCDDCRREVVVYNSCLNRHCPKCGSMARDRWIAARSEKLLPVPYCHVIFTLPHELIPLALQSMKQAAEWLDAYRQHWELSFDRLDEHLQVMKAKETKRERKSR